MISKAKHCIYKLTCVLNNTKIENDIKNKSDYLTIVLFSLIIDGQRITLKSLYI